MRKDTKSSVKTICDSLAKHPFLAAASMCILLFFFGFCEQKSFTTESYVYAGVLLIAFCVLLALLGRLGRSFAERLVIILTAAGFTVGGLILISAYDNSPALILWLSLMLIAALTILLYITDNLSARNFIILMFAAGVMLRYAYCLYTGFAQRQHDVGNFGSAAGHAGYIEYWLKNGLKLPDFDVRRFWQYYQPPLHHWLMALFLKLLTTFGMEYGTACEAIQFLPFLYSSLTMVVSYRIFRYAKLKNLPLVIASAIVAFHPTFALLGGSFNNDMLSTLLSMLAILFALRWYRNPTLLRIIPIALCVGLGMMAKLSAWMVAPAIAIVFLYVFIKNIKSWLKFLGQFALFGVICVPAALWWQVRNLILYQVPLTFVPKLAVTDPQYCGNHTVWERLFDFGNGQLAYVYDAFKFYGAPYYEYNPTLGLLKTSLFDEGAKGITDTNFPQITVTGPLLFWVGVILALLCFVAFIIMMCSKKSGLDGVSRIFFSVLAATMLVCYYIYGFVYPFTCSLNIRFCVPLIPLFAMGLGLLLMRFSGDSVKEKVLRYSAYGLTAAFVLMTLIVYSQLAMPVPTA